MAEPNFTIKSDVDTSDYGKFIIEPLDPGYGHTLGNSIRRVILTTLAGAAVTSVRIVGVKHQFSTLPGLKEDMVEFLLNIKKIRFRMQGEGPVTVSLSAKGPKKVTAADLDSSDIEVVNKELYLGELTSNKAKLIMDLTVESGTGYRTAEEFEGKKEVGSIVVDALFSPVIRVNYKVEATRVGRMTDLDRLVLEVWTDGSLSPFDAVKQSAKILVSYFLQLYEPKAKATEGVVLTPSVSEEILKMTLEELDLPTRIVNALHNGSIDTVGQLLGTPKKELYKIKNLGAKSIITIEEILRNKGIAFTV